MSGIIINNRHYDILGNNHFRDSTTGAIINGDQLSESSGMHIHLGSHNDQSGMNIGNRNIIICPISLKEWKQVSKIALFAAMLLSTIGIIGFAIGTMPLLSVLSLGAGGLLTIPTIFDFRLQE